MKTFITRLLVVLIANTAGVANAQTAWQEIQTPTNQKLNSIQFVDNQIGYVGGDSVLLKTVDGGANWSSLPIDSIMVGSWQGLDIYDMHWFTEDHGIIISGAWGGVFETLDGGVNWAGVGTSSGGFCQTTSLFFFDEDNGFAGGAGCFEGHIIERLSEGVWSTANDPNDWDSENWVASIEFKDALNGLAGTLNGTLLRTTDGGANWDTISNLAGDSAITDFIFYADGTIRATHQNNAEYGVMISNDGGLTWEFDNELASFFYPSMNAAHMDGNGTTYIGGDTYDNDGLVFDNSDTFWNMLTVNQPINDIASHSDSIVFLVGDSGAIYVNTDLSTVGVEDVQQVEFNLAPNPAMNEIQISGLSEQVTAYSVLDIAGRIILEQSQYAADKTIIDVSDLKAGSYLISIQTEKGFGTKRFLKL